MIQYYWKGRSYLPLQVLQILSSSSSSSSSTTKKSTYCQTAVRKQQQPQQQQQYRNLLINNKNKNNTVLLISNYCRSVVVSIGYLLLYNNNKFNNNNNNKRYNSLSVSSYRMNNYPTRTFLRTTKVTPSTTLLRKLQYKHKHQHQNHQYLHTLFQYYNNNDKVRCNKFSKLTMTNSNNIDQYSNNYSTIPLTPRHHNEQFQQDGTFNVDKKCDEVTCTDFSLQSLQTRMSQYVTKNTIKDEKNSFKNEHQDQQQQQDQDQNQCKKIVIAIAGGGGYFLSSLASTSGSSLVFLEGNIVYNRISFQNYIYNTIQQQPWKQPMQQQQQQSSKSQPHSTSQQESQTTTNIPKKFQYSSKEATSFLAQASLTRAMQYNAMELSSNSNKGLVSSSIVLSSGYGIACTSSLQSTLSKRSDRTSRAYIAVYTATGFEICMDIQLGKGLPPLQQQQQQDQDQQPHTNENINNHPIQSQRTRFDEDVFVGHCILSCLEYTQSIEEQQQQQDQQQQDQQPQQEQKSQSGGTNTDRISSESVTTQYGDIITWDIKYHGQAIGSLSSSSFFDKKNNFEILSAIKKVTMHHQQQQSQVQSSATTNNTSGVAMLLPVRSRSNSVTNNDIDNDWSYQLLTKTILPKKSLIVPGSFNPPHYGHIQLANAAAVECQCNMILYEISITNVDKPSLHENDIIQRLYSFLQLQQQQQHDQSKHSWLTNEGTVSQTGTDNDCNINSTVQMPMNWGILLTNAPMFKQKQDLLSPLIVNLIDEDEDDNNTDVSTTSVTTINDDTNLSNDDNYSRNDKNSNNKQIVNFCIGTDTLKRLVDIKYYSNSQEKMYIVLINQMSNSHFIVGGRLEQTSTTSTTKRTTSPESSSVITTTSPGSSSVITTTTIVPKFITGQEYIQNLPIELQSKFTILRKFRADISSSELRLRSNSTRSFIR